MTDMNFEVFGVDEAMAAFVRMDRVLRPNIRQAVEVTARHVKDDGNEYAAGIGPTYLPHLGADPIGYEMDSMPSGFRARIGYIRGKPQAGIPLEYGTPFTAPKPALRRALWDNEDDFTKGISKAVEDTIRHG